MYQQLLCWYDVIKYINRHCHYVTYVLANMTAEYNNVFNKKDLSLMIHYSILNNVQLRDA